MKTIFLSFSITNSSLTDYFVELANEMTKDFKVIVINYGGQKNNFEFSKAVRIYDWPSPRPSKIKDFLFLHKLLKKHRPEIMIANFGAVNMFLLVGSLMRVRQRIAWYRTLSGQLEDKKLLRYRKRLIYKLATKIIANSEATKRDLVLKFNVPERKINVFNNAVRDFGIMNPEIQQNKIIFVGRMDPIKGVDVLIEAIPDVMKEFPDSQFLFIGGNKNGAAIKAYEQRAKALKITRNVEFIGNQGKKKIIEEFSSSYVTVVPSYEEAFGYVVIESFSARTPVIGSDTTGIAETIRNNEDGFLFKVGNSSDLAKKILTLRKDQYLRECFSRNCYERFRDRFEIKTSTKALISFLKLDADV